MKHLFEKRSIAALILTLFIGSAGAAEFMGEYKGTYYPDTIQLSEATADVVKEGEDHYRIRIQAEGGDIEVYGHSSGFEVLIGDRSGGYHWSGNIKNGRLSLRSGYSQHYELEKIKSASPKVGLEAPEEAIVLLPYKEGEKTNLDAWTNDQWKILDDGSASVREGANRTKQKFTDIKHLHIEFRMPLEPNNRGQGRGNSGVFLHDAYEVQVLDSFGLVHTSGDCGGLYNVKRADVNASLPPLVWQTYDINFEAPEVDGEGIATKNARITVLHNGVTIHNDVEIPHPTANPKQKLKPEGPIQIQDHGHPIQFRNIWIVEK